MTLPTGHQGNLYKLHSFPPKQIIENIRQRDYNDSNRKLAPLKKADDAIYINTTNMTIKEVVDKILNYIQNKP